MLTISGIVDEHYGGVVDRASAANRPLGLAEQVCLTLIVQGVSHGWALGTLLASEAELGRIWSLSRPLTYRAVDSLVERALVQRDDPQGAPRRERATLRATPAGRDVTTQWLSTPAAHLRDLRTELLLKVVLRQRAGLEIASLLDAQIDLLDDTITALTTPGPHDDVVALWRQENARAARRFLRQARNQLDSPGGQATRPDVRLSARNQLHVTIDSIGHGDVMSSVRAVLPDGQRLTAAITTDATVELDLAAGDEVVMIIKSTEIMVAKPH